jgi:hypothetical protein
MRPLLYVKSGDSFFALEHTLNKHHSPHHMNSLQAASGNSF